MVPEILVANKGPAYNHLPLRWHREEFFVYTLELRKKKRALKCNFFLCEQKSELYEQKNELHCFQIKKKITKIMINLGKKTLFALTIVCLAIATALLIKKIEKPRDLSENIHYPKNPEAIAESYQEDQ